MTDTQLILDGRTQGPMDPEAARDWAEAFLGHRPERLEAIVLRPDASGLTITFFAAYSRPRYGVRLAEELGRARFVRQ